MLLLLAGWGAIQDASAPPALTLQQKIGVSCPVCEGQGMHAVCEVCRTRGYLNWQPFLNPQVGPLDRCFEGRLISGACLSPTTVGIAGGEEGIVSRVPRGHDADVPQLSWGWAGAARPRGNSPRGSSAPREEQHCTTHRLSSSSAMQVTDIYSYSTSHCMPT